MAKNKLFPEITASAARNLNLDSAAREWATKFPELFAEGKNPLIEPIPCQKMVADTHLKLEVEWSWGGYLENRSFLWKGSYLDQTGGYVHAGVDLNLPAGTVVAAPVDFKIMLVDSDYPVNWGWGSRIFATTDCSQEASKFVFIFAHLEDVAVKSGDSVSAGSQIARIGRPPKNGNWYTHLHLQAVEKGYLDGILKAGIENLDGYFHPNDLEKMSKIFPEPMGLLGLDL